MQAIDSIIRRMLDASCWGMDAAAFDPQKHPRGQPKNAGQFATAGAGYAAATKESQGRKIPPAYQKLVAAPLDKAKWPKWLNVTGGSFFKSQGELKKMAPDKEWPKEGKGWHSIRIATNPDEYYWIAGIDTKGKWQPVRNPKAAAGKDETQKWPNVWACRQEFPQLLAENERNAKNPTALAKKLGTSPDTAKDVTAAMRLIQLMGVRAGGQETASEKEANGTVDLEGRHVKMVGGEMHLKFKGKKNVDIDLVVADPELKKDLTERAKRAGSNGRLFPGVDYQRLSKYVKSLDTSKFTNHNFRHRIATVNAENFMKKMPLPKNEKDYKAGQRAVAEKVCKLLGNNWDEALTSYVHPGIWKAWRASAGV